MNVHHVHIPELPGRGRLGRHVEHDARSYAFAAPEAAGPIHSVMWERHAPIFDQGSLGSCTGNAMAGALMTGPLYEAGRDLTEADAISIYKLATTIDNVPGHYPPDDTGSSGLAVAKASKRLGMLTSYHHAFTVGSLLSALQRGPIIVGVPWFEGFDSPVGDAAELRIGGAVRGGHEFLVRGLDVSAGMLFADNSWGSGWGNAGSMCFTIGTWVALRMQRADAVAFR